VTFEEARRQFPVLGRVAYLNAGTFGPLAQSVFDAMRDEHERALTEGRILRRDVIERVLRVRGRIRARLAATIGVDAERVALTTSTTEACNVVVRGLAVGSGDEVVTTDAEHFGLMGALAVSGATLRIVPVRDRPAADIGGAIADAVTPRTRLIATSHVLWLSGHVVPFAEVREAAGDQRLGDGAQGAGAIPVDAAGADFYTVSGQKWLCGPDLTGALFVREPESLPVALPSYLSQDSYDVSAGTFVPRPGAQRFDTHFTPVAALAGLEAALDLRPDWAFERARRLAELCRARLAERFDVVTEPAHATLVSWRPDGDAEEAAARAHDAGVVIRDLPAIGWLRASCGWWNDEDDIERLVAAL
jgi:L-cysteine/cystine lyase